GRLRRQATTFQNAHEARELVPIGVLSHLLCPKLPGPKLHTFRNTPGDDGDRNVDEAEHIDAEAILNLIALKLEASAVDIAKVDAAIGHDAIDVEPDELDGSRKCRVDHRDTRSQMSTARLIKSSSRSSGIMFGPSLGALSVSGCVSRKNR